MSDTLKFSPIITNATNLPSISIVAGQYIVNVSDGSSYLDITINNEPTRISLSSPLPTASANTLGGIKVGDRLSIDSNGVLSANDQSYTLPTATDSVLGGIKIGTGLSINNGVVSVSSSISVLAENVSITDTGGYYTSSNVEGALQEIGAQLNGVLASLEAI